MLFTRTIRRKMAVGLAFVLVMLFVLAVGGLSGMSSYKQVVVDLEFSISEAPRTEDLVAAIGALSEPLSINNGGKPPTQRFKQFQQQKFADQLQRTRDRIQTYERKLDRLPPLKYFDAKQDVTLQLLQKIRDGLDKLERTKDGMSTSPDYTETLHEMNGQVLELLSKAISVPDFQWGLNEKLQSARKVYRSRQNFLWWSAGASILLFGLLASYAYQAVFSPLSTLHHGALRVAQGDFNYRVDLDTDDEMGELAEAFNKMTARFQEIQTDLDRQVRERSKQLVRSERLAGLGFLAAGVAHEINNPLQAITIAAESLDGRTDEFLAKADPADVQIVKQYLAMIRSESLRCKDITAKLLNFARGQDSARGRFDLVTLTTEVLSLVSHLSKFRDRKIEFFPKGPCPVCVNGPELKQVILNFVSNALEAMDPGGVLKIRITEQTDQVILSFQDQGCGMTPEVIDNLFEPFFTQRKDGKGTGLGLSISHRIISEHGGTIEALSEGAGKGSTFHIHLPRKAASGEMAA